MNKKLRVRLGKLGLHPPYGLHKAISSALRDCTTGLDLGCGHNSVVTDFTDKYLIDGVDRWEPSLSKNRAENSYNKLINCDIRDLTIPDNSYDAVLSIDSIEHFEKEEGFQIIETMKRISRKRVIIYTPNGFVPQDADDNPHQKHLSGWSVHDFSKAGFNVRGVYGLKNLRGSYARLRWKPHMLWELVSLLSEPFVYAAPSASFGLLATWKKS